MPSQEFDVSTGTHSIRIEMDTKDGLYHNNAYFRMDFLIKQKQVCGACTCPTVNTAPGAVLTANPTAFPTSQPTKVPSFAPTSQPTKIPSFAPTSQPTEIPSFAPTTSQPTEIPSVASTATQPSVNPSSSPTDQPTNNPSVTPTVACTVTGPVDLVFVVDGSGSVGANGFELSKQFVGEVADRFTISPSDTQIGIVQFSSLHHQELSIFQGKDLGNIQNALNAMTHMSGGTLTSAAIEFTSSLFNNDRPSAKRVMIVLTDGQSGDFHVLPQAKAVAASLGITMMSVGVGSGIGITELKAIADQDDYVFTMNDFNALVAAVDDFSTEVCEIINLLTDSPSAAPTTNEPTANPSAAPTTNEPTASPSAAPTNAPTVVILDEVLLDSQEESTTKIPWVLILAVIVAICIVCTCWILMDDRVIKCCCPCCVCCCVKKSEDEDEECPKLEESGSRLAQLKATE